MLYEPQPISFPADHLAHPDYRTEWWYITGNLDAADGRRFGFQVTWFRQGMSLKDDSSPDKADEETPGLPMMRGCAMSE